MRGRRNFLTHLVSSSQKMKTTFLHLLLGFAFGSNLFSQTWNIQFDFNPQQGEVGIVWTGTNFWVTKFNAADIVSIYDVTGSYLGGFNVAGIGNVRAMTTDGTYIYMANNTNTINKVNITSQAIIGSFTVPPLSGAQSTVRWITYDPSGSGGFWVGNFGTDMTKINNPPSGTATVDAASTILAATHTLTGMYGAVYDGGTVLGGPYLWVNNQSDPQGGASADVIVQVQLSTGLLTGVQHDVDADYGSSGGLAGGITIAQLPGYSQSLVAINQNVKVVSYELNYPPYLTFTAIVSPITCSVNTGSIDVTVTLGTAPFNYSWSNGATTQDVTALSAGTYSLTVTDSLGTITTNSWTLQASPLTPYIYNITCNGDANGEIYIYTNSSGYYYSWSNGIVGYDYDGFSYISNLSAGSYSVTITDTSGCSVIDTFVVTEPAPITVSNVVTTDVLCAYGYDGTIQMDISGGTGDYEVYGYLVSNNSTAILTGLYAGIYNFDIYDANGCYISVGSYTINEPAELYVSGVNTFTDILCYGDTGSVLLDIVGGTTPYTYLWTNGDTTAKLITTDGSIGYDLTVTDAHGCQSYWGTQYFNAPLPLTVSNYGITNVSCAGAGDGGIYVEISGGTGYYNFSWSNGWQDYYYYSDNYNLSGGVYSFVATDDNGCSITDTFVVTEPTPIIVSLTSNDTTFCGNGIINGSAIGGTGGYSYYWNGGGSTNTTQNCVFSGTYSLEVFDSTGCWATSNPINVTVWDSLQLHLYTTSNSICLGNTTEMYSDSYGGSFNYDITWSPAYTENTPISPTTTTTYTVTLYDSLASAVCGTPSASLTITVNPLPNPSLGADTAICLGSSIVLNALSNTGASPFAYTWSNGSPSIPSQSLSPTANTYYNVAVSDANACVGRDTILVTVNAVPNTPNVSINGFILTSSGTNVTWQWYLNGVAIVGATSQSYTVTQNGNYTVVTTNTAGCSSEISAPISITTVAVENALSLGINVYPNPLGEEALQIVFENASLNHCSVEIIDASGKSIFSESIKNIAQNQVLSFDLNGIASGVYFVKITTEKGNQITKLVKN